MCTRERDFQTLRSNIFAKTKKFANTFLPVHMGPWSNLLSNNGQKSRDTVPLMDQSMQNMAVSFLSLRRLRVQH